MRNFQVGIPSGDGVPSPLSGGRIPSLDGLRALSITFVLLAHLCGTRFFVLGTDVFRVLGDFGNLGVRIFFIISGFLITSLLLKERVTDGRISLKNFYIRRVLRIFPAAYAFISIIWIAGILGLLQVGRADFLAACSYTMNYLRPHGWNLGHLWSLAVEEQFYLIWPLALCVAGKKRGMLVAGIMFALGPLTRYACTHYAPDCVWLGDNSFLSNADALASGCLLSGLWGRLGISKHYYRFQRSWLFLVVPLVAGVCVSTSLYMKGLKVSLLNVCIALCIDWCVRRHDVVIGRILNWRPIAFVGVLSYSLYLWQQPFLNRSSFHFINAFPVNLLLAFTLAAVSYFCVEIQFLKLRKRFLAKKVPVAPSPRTVRNLVTSELVESQPP